MFVAFALLPSTRFAMLPSTRFAMLPSTRFAMLPSTRLSSLHFRTLGTRAQETPGGVSGEPMTSIHDDAVFTSGCADMDVENEEAETEDVPRTDEPAAGGTFLHSSVAQTQHIMAARRISKTLAVTRIRGGPDSAIRPPQCGGEHSEGQMLKANSNTKDTWQATFPGCSQFSFSTETSGSSHDQSRQFHEQRSQAAVHVEQSFPCDMCEDVFQTKTQRKRHKRKVHSSRPVPDYLTCVCCQVTFPTKSLRKKHQRSVHPEIFGKGGTPFPCTVPGCKQLFKDGATKKAHLRKNHPNRPEIPELECAAEDSYRIPVEAEVNQESLENDGFHSLPVNEGSEATASTYHNEKAPRGGHAMLGVANALAPPDDNATHD